MALAALARPVPVGAEGKALEGALAAPAFGGASLPWREGGALGCAPAEGGSTGTGTKPRPMA